MPETSSLISQFFVKIDGALVSTDFMHDVFEVTVQNSLHLPDVATIVLNDPKLKWIDDTLLSPGKAIEILGAASPPPNKSEKMSPKLKSSFWRAPPARPPNGPPALARW